MIKKFTVTQEIAETIVTLDYDLSNVDEETITNMVISFAKGDAANKIMAGLRSKSPSSNEWVKNFRRQSVDGSLWNGLRVKGVVKDKRQAALDALKSLDPETRAAVLAAIDK